MKISRILAIVGAVVLALILVVPFLIPVQTTGTATYKEVAGEGATFATAQGIDIYYEKTDFVCQEDNDCSNPPVIFLLHGFGANTFSYREVIEPLSQLGDVIAYDRPGFGLSESVILVGHSAGGTLAAQYVVDNKDAIQGLILISPAILSTGGSPSWLNWIFSIPQLDHLGPLLVSSIASSGMDLLNESWYNKDLITEEVKAGYREPLSVIGWEEGFWEFNRAPRAFDVKDRLDEITVPTLLITGDTDTVVATTDTEALANMIKDSVLFVIPQSGHLAQEETPEDTMKAIRVVWSILTR